MTRPRLGVKRAVVEAVLTALDVEPDEMAEQDFVVLGMMTEADYELTIAGLQVKGAPANPLHKAAARKLFWGAKQDADDFKNKYWSDPPPAAPKRTRDETELPLDGSQEDAQGAAEAEPPPS